MSAYRIKVIEHCGSTRYELQKKSFLGFWYNPDNIDAYTTGFYDTLPEANEAYLRKVTPEKIHYVSL